MSIATSDRCYIGIPKWAWNVGVLGGLGALITAVAGWVGTELVAARDANEAHAERLSVLVQRVDTHDKVIEKMDSKLDRILDEVRK